MKMLRKLHGLVVAAQRSLRATFPNREIEILENICGFFVKIMEFSKFSGVVFKSYLSEPL